MSTTIVPFQGGAYALVEQQDEVWKILHNERNLGPGAGESVGQAASWQASACVVTLRSKIGTEAPFHSKAQSEGSKWTAEEQKTNLTSMKKLWRHEHPEEKTKRKAKSRAAALGGANSNEQLAAAGIGSVSALEEPEFGAAGSGLLPFPVVRINKKKLSKRKLEERILMPSQGSMTTTSDFAAMASDSSFSTPATASGPRQRVVVKRTVRTTDGEGGVPIIKHRPRKGDRGPQLDSGFQSADEPDLEPEAEAGSGVDGSGDQSEVGSSESSESESDGRDCTSPSAPEDGEEQPQKSAAKRQRTLELSALAPRTISATSAVAIAQRDLCQKAVPNSGCDSGSVTVPAQLMSPEEAAAARADRANALFDLGAAHVDGVGVPVDIKKGKELWEQAAKLEHAEAQNSLGWLYKCIDSQFNHYRLSGLKIELWELAANQGNANAQYNLAGLRLNYGVHHNNEYVDKIKGAELLELAAAQGHADAQYNLGCLYWEGEVVTTDKQKAVALWKLAAEQGNPKAEFNFGCINYFGLGSDFGISMDKPKAIALWKLAAEKRQFRAQQNITVLVNRGELKDDISLTIAREIVSFRGPDCSDLTLFMVASRACHFMPPTRGRAHSSKVSSKCHTYSVTVYTDFRPNMYL